MAVQLYTNMTRIKLVLYALVDSALTKLTYLLLAAKSRELSAA